MKTLSAILVALIGFIWAATAGGEVLLRDDFDGPALDTSKWFVPTGPGTFLGRTQIRPPSEPLTVAGGILRLQLDTHNPTALIPGDSFWGSEIDTIESYEVGSGLSFEARIRFVSGLPGGLVGSLFSFVFLPEIPGRDEIDFELLSNDWVVGEERVLTNVFDDDDFSQAGNKAFATLPGLDLSDFHVFTIHWRPDRVDWLIDGEVVRAESNGVPDDPQNIRLNFWAPDMFFPEAFDGDLVPATSSATNVTYYYEVDFVEIARLPKAVPALGIVNRSILVGSLIVIGAVIAGLSRGAIHAINR